MAWTPPTNLIPLDRRNIRTALEADIPDVLAWLKSKYSGGTVDGVFITGKDTQSTYYVQQVSDGSLLTEKIIKAGEFNTLKARVTAVEAGGGGGGGISSVHTDGTTITGDGTAESPLAIGVIAGLADGLSGIRLHATSTQTVETTGGYNEGGFDAPVLTYTFHAESPISIGQVILHQNDFVGRTLRILDSQDGVMGAGTFVLAGSTSKVVLSGLVSVGSGTTFKVQITKGSAPDASPSLNSNYPAGTLLIGGTLTFISGAAPNHCPWLTFVAVGASKQVVGPLDAVDLPAGFSTLPARVATLESNAGAGLTRLSDVAPTTESFYRNDAVSMGYNDTSYVTTYQTIRALSIQNIKTTSNSLNGTSVSIFNDQGVVLGTTTWATNTDPDDASILHLKASFASVISIGAGLNFSVHAGPGHVDISTSGQATPNSLSLAGGLKFISNVGDDYNVNLSPLYVFSSGNIQHKQVLGPLDISDLPTGYSDLPSRVTSLETAVVASAHPTIYLSNVPAVTTLYDNTNGQDKQMGGDYATSYTDFGILAGGSDLTFAEIEVSYFLDTGTLTQLKAQVYTTDASYNPVALLETALSAERTDHPSGAVFIPINFAASRTIPAGQKLLIRISTVQGLYHRMNHGAFSTPNPVTLNGVTFTVKQNMAGDTSRGDLCGFALKLGIPAASKNAVGPLDPTDLPGFTTAPYSSKLARSSDGTTLTWVADVQSTALPQLKAIPSTALSNNLTPYSPSYWPTSNGRLVMRMNVLNPVTISGLTIKSSVDGVTQFTSAIYNSNSSSWTQGSLISSANTNSETSGGVQTVFTATHSVTLAPGAYLLVWTPGPLNQPVSNAGSFNFSRSDNFSTNTPLGSDIVLSGSAHENPFYNIPTDSNPAIQILLGGKPKGVVGPLDPSDFPVVTDVGLLLNDSGAIFDNLTDPPRLVRKRPDGTVWYGPVFSTTP